MDDCHFHFITNFIRKHYFDKRFLGPWRKAFMFRIFSFLNLTWWSFWSTHWHIHTTHILGQLLNKLTTFEIIFTIYIFMWQLAKLHGYSNFFLDSKIMIRWSSIPIKKHLLSCQLTIGTFHNEKIVGKNSLCSKSCIILNQYSIFHLISFEFFLKKKFQFF